MEKVRILIVEEKMKSNSTDQDKPLKGFDKKRRTFLKKLLISSAYATPTILTISMRNLEAKKRRPSRKERKEKKKIKATNVN